MHKYTESEKLTSPPSLICNSKESVIEQTKKQNLGVSFRILYSYVYQGFLFNLPN